MSQFNRNILAGASGAQGYQISRSVRLRSSASAYLNRTPASAGSLTTWTWSAWIKRGRVGDGQNQVLMGSNAVGEERIGFVDNDTFVYYNWNGSYSNNQVTTQVFRDPSAWYHFVVVRDTTNATAANRIRIYVNGQQITSFATNTLPAQNASSYNFNTTASHQIGRWPSGIQYFDGYLTEVNFIDGQALTPSSFGETNPVTGVWQPKKYAGTYGTNGFYLNFSDNSAATAAAIGKDYSGNGNNWTPNNISVTAGVTYDSMIDVPTPYADGGNGRGNYATWSPIDKSPTSSVSQGNLYAINSSATYQSVRSTIGVTSGKWYWEIQAGDSVGIATQQSNLSSTNDYLPNGGTAWAYVNNGNKSNAGTNTGYGAMYTASDVIGVAFDADAGSLTFYKNGTSQGVAYSTGLTGQTYFAWCSLYNSSTGVINFGQRPFAYTPPTGFKALNTQNLPEPTIVDGRKQFNAVLYTGNGSTQSITGVGFQPDLVWTKGRGSATFNNHLLYDHVRGVQRIIQSNSTAAEGVVSNGLTSFNSNGFSIGSFEDGNTNNNAYVAWNWKANGAGVSNTAGSITSTVSANTTSGFSVVTYTGTGANATVGHGLGVAPKLIILKDRSRTDRQWPVYHASLGAVNLGFLNLTNAWASSPSTWNSTVPTSSVFSLGTDATSNQSGDAFVAYCFAEVAGFSRFGSYTGNGSTDGPFVYCGFRPRFILLKNYDIVQGWCIVDTATGTYNLLNNYLQANSSAAESSGYAKMDILSNGFKLRETDTFVNDNGRRFIYAAFAEHPFKYAIAR